MHLNNKLRRSTLLRAGVAALALASLSSGFGGIHSTVVLEGRGSRERRHAA